jgi:ATP-dependent Clp protease adaptor protein ClpS
MSKFIKNTDQDNKVLIKKSTKKKLKRPSLYKIIMLNDDYTPMDFVVYLLKTFFKKNHNEASKIMLEVHNKGSSICGIFTYEIAETKILKVVNTSRKNGFPLLCTMEKT